MNRQTWIQIPIQTETQSSPWNWGNSSSSIHPLRTAGRHQQRTTSQQQRDQPQTIFCSSSTVAFYSSDSPLDWQITFHSITISDGLPRRHPPKRRYPILYNTVRYCIRIGIRKKEWEREGSYFADEESRNPTIMCILSPLKLLYIQDQIPVKSTVKLEFYRPDSYRF